MSLINDMLKDLEKRHAEEAFPKGVVLAGIGVHPSAVRVRSFQWLFYLGGALAMAILVFIFHDGFYRHAPALIAGFTSNASGLSPAPVNKPQTSEAAAPALPAMVASIEPPAGDALTTGVAPDQSSVQANTGLHGDGGASDSVAVSAAASKQTGEAADHQTTVPFQASAPESDASLQDVKQSAGVASTDHGGDAGDTAKGEVVAQIPPDKAVVSRHQEDSAAPVHLKRRVPLTIKERARQLRGQALRLARQGDLDQAEDELSKALSLEPRHVAARGALAGLMIQNGQLTQAAALLDRGLKLRPGSATLTELRARVYVMQGDNQRARMLLEEHAPTVSQDPEYHAMLAAVYQRLGDYAKAGAVYQQLVTEKPENGVWWLGLGLSMEATGRMAEARQAYEKAQGSKILSPTLRQFVKEKLSSLS